METHEPSPGWALRSSSTLKPLATVSDSAGVASLGFRPPPGALAAPADARTAPHGCIPCLPRLVAAANPATSVAVLFQPAISLVDPCQEESLTTASFLPPARDTSSLASNPAGPPLFAARMASR